MENIVILGDFNYSHVDLANVFSSHDVETRFPDIINYYALEQLVMEVYTWFPAAKREL